MKYTCYFRIVYSRWYYPWRSYLHATWMIPVHRMCTRIFIRGYLLVQFSKKLSKSCSSTALFHPKPRILIGINHTNLDLWIGRPNRSFRRHDVSPTGFRRLGVSPTRCFSAKYWCWRLMHLFMVKLVTAPGWGAWRHYSNGSPAL